MSDFDVDFVSNPSVKELKAANVKKDDLKFIAANYRIHFTRNTTKTQLKCLILEYVEDSETASPSPLPSPNPQDSLEIESVKLQAMQLKPTVRAGRTRLSTPKERTAREGQTRA